MMIRVEYHDGQQQLVRPYLLNKLIAEKAIARFERSDGWAVLGAAPLRAMDGRHHVAKERRAPFEKPHEADLIYKPQQH